MASFEWKRADLNTIVLMMALGTCATDKKFVAWVKKCAGKYAGGVNWGSMSAEEVGGLASCQKEGGIRTEFLPALQRLAEILGEPGEDGFYEAFERYQGSWMLTDPDTYYRLEVLNAAFWKLGAEKREAILFLFWIREFAERHVLGRLEFEHCLEMHAKYDTGANASLLSVLTGKTA